MHQTHSTTMAQSKPIPSMALLAALLLPTATTADVIRIQMTPATPLNSAHRSPMIPTPMIAAIEKVHNACATELFYTCQQAPSPPQDPFESFFGLPSSSAGARSMISFGAIGGGMHSDPFGPMRTLLDSDPFLRLAATPPTSPLTSSGLIDDIVGDFDRMVDDMMNSAIRFGMAADDGSRTMSKQREEKTHAEEGQKQKEDDASSADLAEAALERMVNSFFGHVVSASAASRPSAVSEDTSTPIVVQEDNVEVTAEKNEEEEDDHPQAPRVSDGDVQREVLSHDDSSPDSVIQVSDKADSVTSASLVNIEASYGDGGLDPIAMAKRIVHRGKAILETEEAAENESELRRRRRLTVEDGPEPEVRRRLARRLTEVVPFVGMPIRVMVFPFEGDGSGLRVLIREPEFEPEPEPQWQQRPAPLQRADATPRLMLGCSVDSCLWDMYDGNQVSGQCAASLSQVLSVHSQLLEDEERRKSDTIAALNTFVTSENIEVADGISPTFFFVWLGFFVASIYACLSCGGDDEDDDEEYSPEDYFVLADDEGNAPPADHTFIYLSPPCKSFSTARRSASRDDESGVYTGIPVV